MKKALLLFALFLSLCSNAQNASPVPLRGEVLKVERLPKTKITGYNLGMGSVSSIEIEPTIRTDLLANEKELYIRFYYDGSNSTVYIEDLPLMINAIDTFIVLTADAPENDRQQMYYRNGDFFLEVRSFAKKANLYEWRIQVHGATSRRSELPVEQLPVIKEILEQSVGLLESLSK